MKNIKQVESDRFGGGDGKAINRHSRRTYELLDSQGMPTGQNMFLDKILDADPPCFAAYGPVSKDFKGVIQPLHITGLGKAKSWQTAEKLLDETAARLEKEPAITVICSTSTESIKERLRSIHEQRGRGLRILKFPERDRHPAVFVPLMCNTVRIFLGKNPICIGTHSPDVVNALGRMFDDKEFAKEDIRIDIVHEDKSITSHRFDDNGCLTDWPVGFFVSDFTPRSDESQTQPPTIK